MQLQEESRPYYNFINSIRSDSSKVSYGGELRRYLRHYNILSVDKLLESPESSAILILSGMALLGAMIIITGKYRLFERKSAEFMTQLEEEFQKNDLSVSIIPVETGETLDFLNKRKVRKPKLKTSNWNKVIYARAYYLLQILMGIFILLLGWLGISAGYFSTLVDASEPSNLINSTEVTDKNGSSFPDVSGFVATGAAVGALVYTGLSFNRLRKTEELKFTEAIYRDIARGMKEHNLLEAESPKPGEEELVYSRKLTVLLSETFSDINWLCFLIRHGRIKDGTLVNAFKDSIIDWYHIFEERMPEKVSNMESYPDFKILYRTYKKEREEKRNETTN